MKIQQINLGDEMPESIVVRLTLREAALITKVMGSFNVPAADAFMPRGHQEASEEFFDRFWDGGVDDALKALP